MRNQLISAPAVMILMLKLLTFAQPSLATVRCDGFFSTNASAATPFKIFAIGNRGVAINDSVAVTGEHEFPVATVLRDLQIEPSMIEKWRVRKLSVLSIAEGVSHLVPVLARANVNVRGLDVWYDRHASFPDNPMGLQMRAYLESYGQYLIKGDARHLTIKSETVDVVLCRMLANNLHIAEALEAVSEILRVVSVGGEARVYGFSEAKAAATLAFLQANFPSEMQNISIINGLLRYRKRTHLDWPKKLSIGWDKNMAYEHGDLSGPLAEPIFP